MPRGRPCERLTERVARRLSPLSGRARDLNRSGRILPVNRLRVGDLEVDVQGERPCQLNRACEEPSSGPVLSRKENPPRGLREPPSGAQAEPLVRLAQVCFDARSL